MFDLIEALEVGESSIVSRSWALCLLLDCVAILPLGVHETDLMFSDDRGTNIVSHGIKVVVDLVLRGIGTCAGDVELTSAETVRGLRDGELVGARLN